MSNRAGVTIFNAAVDETVGTRDLYFIPAGIPSLPKWTEQLASFDKSHLLKHEGEAPGLAVYIEVLNVQTVTFDELLQKSGLHKLDLLQIDAEGMDALMLAWFPFHRIKPGLLHYEVEHMSSIERQTVRSQLHDLGYRIFPGDSPTDEMAVLF